MSVLCILNKIPILYIKGKNASNFRTKFLKLKNNIHNNNNNNNVSYLRE